MFRAAQLTALFMASLAAGFGQPAETTAYRWTATGPLGTPRYGACAAALPGGRILVAGGVGTSGLLRSVEIHQPDGTFLPAPDMLRPRAGHTCTALPDGRVLVVGGQGDGPSLQAEWFDPALKTWNPVEGGVERWNHSATLLPDGRVLLAGGEVPGGASPLLEWFNPAANRIRALPGSLSAARKFHAAAPLPDGSVLVSGGWNGQTILDAADIVKLDGTVQSIAPLPKPRAGHTATALDNGCILLAGGLGPSGGLESASLYCADTAAYRPAGDMSSPRFLHLTFVLPDNGKVLIAGGFNQEGATATSELYDPEANTFLPAGSLTRARFGIAGAADPVSGAVLALGGLADEGPLAACGILRGPTVVFDKARYIDGDTVIVSGLGWTPGERVNLQVSTQSFAPPGTLSQIVVRRFQPVASPLGRIQQTILVASPLTAGATYRVAASGVTSLLTAGNSARQVARTAVTLSASPFPALTRQPVLLQAIVQPAATLDPLDGRVDFQTIAGPAGSVSSTGVFTTVLNTGQIADGTSNTIQLGQGPLGPTSTGFSRTIASADGSVRNLNAGAAFQLVTRDIPAGTSTLTLSAGSATASYASFTSLYAPNSASAALSIQKRTMNVAISPVPTFLPPKVGDPVSLIVSLVPTQQPLADLRPTGSVHLTTAPGTVVDGTLSPGGSGTTVQSSFNLRLPAGVRTFSAQYDGDAIYLPGSVAGAGAVNIGKGTIGFSLAPGKPAYTVGEQITLAARITHPKVVGATPSGQIARVSGPAQFQGATVASDLGNTGTIDTNLPVGFPTAGEFAIAMTYSGDVNFESATASTTLTVNKALPQITPIAPAQVVAGQEAVFIVRAGAPANLAFRPAVTGQVSLTGVANGPTASLVPSSGTSIGTLRYTFPSAGTFTVTVQYAGDANFLSAVSAPVQVVVQ